MSGIAFVSKKTCSIYSAACFLSVYLFYKKIEKTMAKRKRMTDEEYRAHYMDGWTSVFMILFDGDRKGVEMVMRAKEAQFDLKAYKKSLKLQEKRDLESKKEIDWLD